MTRKIIKEENYKLQDVLKKGERIETDVEWHASLLSDIQYEVEGTNIAQKDLKSLLEDIKDDISYIRNHYEEMPKPDLIKQELPTPGWQVVFNGFIFLVAVVAIAVAIATT